MKTQPKRRRLNPAVDFITLPLLFHHRDSIWKTEFITNLCGPLSNHAAFKEQPVQFVLTSPCQSCHPKMSLDELEDGKLNYTDDRPTSCHQAYWPARLNRSWFRN